jgi:hypothetical protein
VSIDVIKAAGRARIGETKFASNWTNPDAGKAWDDATKIAQSWTGSHHQRTFGIHPELHSIRVRVLRQN